MAEQGDGSHVGPNDESPILLEVDQMGDMEHIILIIAVHPFIPHGQELVAFFQRHIWDEDGEPDHNNENDEDVFFVGLIDVVNIDNNNVNNNAEGLEADYDNDDNNNDGGDDDFQQVAVEGAEAEVEVDHHVEEAEEDPLLGGSRRRSREEDSEDHNNKRSRPSDDFSSSDSDKDFQPGSPGERESAEEDEDERHEF